jgi:hypothetical protein
MMMEIISMSENEINCVRCPICEKSKYEQKIKGGSSIIRGEFGRLTNIGMEEESIGLLVCIRRYNATCNDNYNLFLHVAELYERIKFISIEKWDFRLIYLTKHNMTLKDLQKEEDDLT